MSNPTENEVQQEQHIEAPEEVHVEEIQDNEFESEAKAQGWVPKENFRGDDKDWVDAETFVRRGREIMPILRKNNERLLKELDVAKKAAEEAREVAKEFRQFQKEQFERKTAEMQSELQQLREAKKEAISLGDGERVLALDDAIDDLKQRSADAKAQFKEADQEAKEQANQQPTQDPVFNEWLERNEWFGKDTKITAMANGLGAEIRRLKPSLVGKEFLDELDKELADLVPAEKIGKKKVASNPMDGQSGSSGNGVGRPSKGKKSYDSLPSDAKAACDRFVKQGLMTKEQYVSEYDWN